MILHLREKFLAGSPPAARFLAPAAILLAVHYLQMMCRLSFLAQAVGSLEHLLEAIQSLPHQVWDSGHCSPGFHFLGLLLQCQCQVGYSQAAWALG